jgi:hypothetical protein
MLENIATQKQINAIVLIEKQCEIKFNGSTKEEVSSFIGKYLHHAKILQSLENEINIPVYKATFSQRDKDGEEIFDFRDEVNQKLKGNILRNKSVIDMINKW